MVLRPNQKYKVVFQRSIFDSCLPPQFDHFQQLPGIFKWFQCWLKNWSALHCIEFLYPENSNLEASSDGLLREGTRLYQCLACTCVHLTLSSSVKERNYPLVQDRWEVSHQRHPCRLIVQKPEDIAPSQELSPGCLWNDNRENFRLSYHLLFSSSGPQTDKLGGHKVTKEKAPTLPRIDQNCPVRYLLNRFVHSSAPCVKIKTGGHWDHACTKRGFAFTSKSRASVTTWISSTKTFRAGPSPPNLCNNWHASCVHRP